MDDVERFTFFFHTASPFSQWNGDAPFRKYDIDFNTAEHFMVWYKARLFDADPAVIEKILRSSPREAKAIGRSRNDIPNFRAEIWDVVAEACVLEGNFAKFSQNPNALTALLQTAGTTLVEASPSDRIWGIGLRADDPRAHSRATWQGQNKLGIIVTEVRDTFLRIINNHSKG